VLHNTVILSGTYPFAIEYRFPDTTGVEIRFNLTDNRIVSRDGASGNVADNSTSATSDLFVDLANNDLHLRSTAALVIDFAPVHPDVSDDFDGQLRPTTGAASRDLGADEFLSVVLSEVLADFDGDGKSDIGVYRDGNWFIRRTSDGGVSGVGWGGLPQDKPVAGDYDGDGKTDIALYRDGSWFIIRSSDGGVTAIGWGGLAQDKPVQADYDGDGKTDIAVYRDGTWFILRSSDRGVTVTGWGGLIQDVAVPADYDGDGKADIGIYRDGGWFIIQSSNGGVTQASWGGLVQDIPLSRAQ
jgi:hypothetical protein